MALLQQHSISAASSWRAHPHMPKGRRAHRAKQCSLHPVARGSYKAWPTRMAWGRKKLNLAGRVVAVASCTLGLAGMGNSVLPGRMTRFQHNPVRRDQSEKILANEMHSKPALSFGCRIQTCTQLRLSHSKCAGPSGSFQTCTQLRLSHSKCAGPLPTIYNPNVRE